MVTKGEQTRDAILEKALEVASRVGLSGLTIGTLAEELDLSKSGLFAHFDSKENLQLALLDRAAVRFAEVVLLPALAEPPGERRLRVLFERWLEWPKRVRQPGGCIWVAAASELDDRPGAARERLVALWRDWLSSVARVVRSGQKAGAFRPDVDPEQVAFEMNGIGLVWHLEARLLGDRRALERARAAFDRLVDDARPRR
jgi:AcrR family transcriptional regulator